MKKRIMVCAFLMVFLVVAPAQADFYTDQSAWEAAVSSFAAVDLSGLTSYSVYSSVAMGDGQTLSFSPAVEARQVGAGWATWSGGRTPMVLYTQGAYSVTGTFDGGYTAFGLYAEPNPFALYEFTFETVEGFVTQWIHGSSGASFLGFATSSIITGWTLSSTVDFAFGEMVYGTSAVPEPATMLLLGLGLVGLAALRRKF
jgi:hypothetical protein